MVDNIHPIFNQSLQAADKEKKLTQKGLVIWMVGLSGSGKSTLATGLENKLHEAGYHTMLLDGDNLRSGINSNLSFSDSDRLENIRRASEIAKLFANNGTVTICSLISPTKQIRELASSILGDKYYEVFVNCPLKVCEERDVKGLYAKARNGEIKNFTGIDSPFEDPDNPNLEIKTDLLSLNDSLDLLFENIVSKIKY
ncbi:MAG TPA: adenylyl-sulfate kinase [Fulvivirga sp.]|nr:adenylyl-sulfate kinase [Fulvivirga sp.]